MESVWGGGIEMTCLSGQWSCPVWLPLLTVVSGCALFDAGADSVFQQKPDFASPDQIIPLWSDTVLHTAGKPGVRGCGGRIMFYVPDSKEAVRVDGTLKVYAWNDTAPVKKRQPDREYVFKADDLQKHYSESKAGHSYSFWLPWDEAGGQRTELTVLARFVGRNGSDISTAPSKVILPGHIPMPKPPQASRVEAADGNDISRGDTQASANRTVRQVSWEQPPPTQKKVSIRSTEIQLTPGFVERNQQTTARVLSGSDLFESVDESVGVENSDPPGSTPDGTVELPGKAQQTSDSAADTPKGLLDAAGNPPLRPDINVTETARQSARSLRDRYRAQRERLARRVSSALPKEPVPEAAP